MSSKFLGLAHLTSGSNLNRVALAPYIWHIMAEKVWDCGVLIYDTPHTFHSWSCES